MEKTYLLVGFAIVVLIPLVSAIVGMVATLIRLRRDPPLPEVLARDYATKVELKSIEAHIAADLASIRREQVSAIADFRRDARETDAEIFNLIRNLTASINKSMSDNEKAVARIEGILKNCPAARQCTP